MRDIITSSLFDVTLIQTSMLELGTGEKSDKIWIFKYISAAAVSSKRYRFRYLVPRWFREIPIKVFSSFRRSAKIIVKNSLFSHKIWASLTAPSPGDESTPHFSLLSPIELSLATLSWNISKRRLGEAQAHNLLFLDNLTKLRAPNQTVGDSSWSSLPYNNTWTTHGRESSNFT